MRSELTVTTESGTIYKIKDLKADETVLKDKETGFVIYSGQVARLGGNIIIGADSDDEEYHGFYTALLPAVGDSFHFIHELWGGCYSTPVVSLDN